MSCKPGNRINANILNVFRPERRVKLYVYKEIFDWLFSCLQGIQRKGYIVFANNQYHLEHKACSQKSGNVANIRTSRQGAKNLQFYPDAIFK